MGLSSMLAWLPSPHHAYSSEFHDAHSTTCHAHLAPQSMAISPSWSRRPSTQIPGTATRERLCREFFAEPSKWWDSGQNKEKPEFPFFNSVRMESGPRSEKYNGYFSFNSRSAKVLTIEPARAMGVHKTEIWQLHYFHEVYFG